MDISFTSYFANDWVASWNNHDLQRILAHYSDDFEMSSPKIIQIANEPTGTLRGKKAVGTYWANALQLLPGLHFELITTLVGVNSITLYYKNQHDCLVAEVFHFDADQKIIKAFAHYSA